MINLSVRLTDAGAMPVAASKSASSLAADSSSSFESQLSEAVSQALTEMGINPNSVQVTVNGLPSQTVATSPNPVTPVTPPITSAPAPAPAPSQQDKSTNAVDPDDAYWAKQPAAVQKLRGISDETQRAAMAMQLASEGYTIDYPIMVEGWDPQIATQIRQAAGYTWVPSALQSPVPVAPGLTFPGLTTYDPNNPPPGSILV